MSRSHASGASSAARYAAARVGYTLKHDATTPCGPGAAHEARDQAFPQVRAMSRHSYDI